MIGIHQANIIVNEFDGIFTESILQVTTLMGNLLSPYLEKMYFALLIFSHICGLIQIVVGFEF